MSYHHSRSSQNHHCHLPAHHAWLQAATTHLHRFHPGKCSVPRPGSPVPSTPERREGLRAYYWEGPSKDKINYQPYWANMLLRIGCQVLKTAEP